MLGRAGKGLYRGVEGGHSTVGHWRLRGLGRWRGKSATGRLLDFPLSGLGEIDASTIVAWF
jgi:hypothetical protein